MRLGGTFGFERRRRGGVTGGGATVGVVISAAVIAFDAGAGWVTGQNPPAISIALPTDVQVGDWYRIEHSQNAFATSLFTAWHQITSDDVINSIESGGYALTWDTSALPAGSTSFRLFLGRGADAGSITLQSPASNVITDTMASPDATMTMTDGAYSTALPNKSKYSIVAAPDYQAVLGAAIGLPVLARSNKAATHADFYIEFALDGWAASGGALFIGFDDASINLATNNSAAGFFASNAAFPGEGGGAGFIVGFPKGATQLYGWLNGGEGNVGSAMPAVAPGDRLGFAYHGSVAHPVIAISHIRAGSVTRLGTVILTSQIPANVWPLIGGQNGDATAADGHSDCATLKPKTTDWTGTPPSDGVTYTFAA